jgi:F-type H+-transporting ATPase subunit b
MKQLILALFLLTASGVRLPAQENAAKTEAAPEAGDPWLVWKWANFVILAAGLGYLISKTLPPFFQSRSTDIQKGIAEAQQLKREAERRFAEMEKRLSALGAEIESFRKQSQAEMEKEGQRIAEETAQQIRKLQAQGEQEIESAGKNARRDLSAFAADLSLKLAEQRIQNRLNPELESSLADGFIDDLKQQNLQQGSRN